MVFCFFFVLKECFIIKDVYRCLPIKIFCGFLF